MFKFLYLGCSPGPITQRLHIQFFGEIQFKPHIFNKYSGHVLLRIFWANPVQICISGMPPGPITQHLHIQFVGEIQFKYHIFIGILFETHSVEDISANPIQICISGMLPWAHNSMFTYTFSR